MVDLGRFEEGDPGSFDAPAHARATAPPCPAPRHQAGTQPMPPACMPLVRHPWPRRPVGLMVPTGRAASARPPTLPRCRWPAPPRHRLRLNAWMAAAAAAAAAAGQVRPRSWGCWAIQAARACPSHPRRCAGASPGVFGCVCASFGEPILNSGGPFTRTWIRDQSMSVVDLALCVGGWIEVFKGRKIYIYL